MNVILFVQPLLQSHLFQKFIGVNCRFALQRHWFAIVRSWVLFWMKDLLFCSPKRVDVIFVETVQIRFGPLFSEIFRARLLTIVQFRHASLSDETDELFFLGGRDDNALIVGLYKLLLGRVDETVELSASGLRDGEIFLAVGDELLANLLLIVLLFIDGRRTSPKILDLVWSRLYDVFAPILQHFYEHFDTLLIAVGIQRSSKIIFAIVGLWKLQELGFVQLIDAVIDIGVFKGR